MKTVTPEEKKDKTTLKAFMDTESVEHMGDDPTYALICVIYDMVKTMLREHLDHEHPTDRKRRQAPAKRGSSE